MAAASECKVLEEIGEDFLCCTICLEQFKSPKILPCLHTFCEQCLVTLVEKTGSLNCPECRQQYQLPVGGVPAIKGNFFMSNLIEIFKQRLESMRGTETKCEACQENTATHRCVECKHYLCNICVKAHRKLPITQTHRLMTIGEHETAMTTSPVTLQTVEHCSVHPNIEIAFYCETCQIHSDLTEQCSREERKVRMKAEEIIKKIKREEQRLIDELKNNYKMKIKRAAIDIDEMELKHGNIKSAGNQVIPKQQVKAKVRKPDASWEDIYAADNRDGTHRVTVAGQLDGKYQVIMTIGDQPIPGCPVIIPVIKGLVKTIGSEGSAEGQYNNAYGVAINKDRDIVTADRNNNRLHITSSEGTFNKSLEFKEFKKPFTPRDIAISSDNTYHSLDDNNNQVVVSDENGHVIRYFGQNELKDPWGIGISPVDGNVYVTDYGGHCVRIYTQHGEYLRSFGSEGKGEEQFNRLWGVDISSTGMVFVADYDNKRIQVFNADDQYLYSFDCQSGDGKMRYPRGIAIENDKYVYVTTGYPSSVLKFDSSGKFVCRIDTDSDGLSRPTDVALTDDVPCRVVVADKDNHCIKVFVQ
ncbi:tripartite motif-containing protein 2-like [Ptychodera flava]|uniref:tripartite motif-containing protein 2-like n=1 Tax=Ptychodera flava TaxID=63121 RepID=UPI00396A1743